MSKIRVLTVKKMANAVELTVNSLENAEWLAENAKEAGFDAKVKDQTGGLSGTNMRHVLIGKSGGGKFEDLRAYLEGNAELELPDNW